MPGMTRMKKAPMMGAFSYSIQGEHHRTVGRQRHILAGNRDGIAGHQDRFITHVVAVPALDSLGAAGDIVEDQARFAAVVIGVHIPAHDNVVFARLAVVFRAAVGHSRIGVAGIGETAV